MISFFLGAFSLATNRKRKAKQKKRYHLPISDINISAQTDQQKTTCHASKCSLQGCSDNTN
jgi:hypothetical protein